MKYAFLILHYQNVAVTLSCIDSIKSKCGSNDYQIVLVDNNSPNKSGVWLQRKFHNDASITVILSNENLGFAKGNNIGFSYIKYQICPDYIIMMNNDTEIIDDSFLREISIVDKKYSPAVIGPQITLANGEIGKYPFEAVDIKYLRKEIVHFRIKRFLCKIGLSKLLNLLNSNNDLMEVKENNWKLDHENVVLNGCCLIFTKKYINLFDGIFDQTFMYKEEQFLFYRLLRSNLSSVYAITIRIKHLEGASTNSFTSKKAIDFYSREITSDKLLISYLKNKDLL